MFADTAQRQFSPANTSQITTARWGWLMHLTALLRRRPRLPTADQLTDHLMSDLNLQRRDLGVPDRDNPPLDPRLTTLF